MKIYQIMRKKFTCLRMSFFQEFCSKYSTNLHNITIAILTVPLEMSLLQKVLFPNKSTKIYEQC